MATIVSTPAELDAVRNALGAGYEIGANIDLDGYGRRFQRFAVDDASALLAGMSVFQYSDGVFVIAGQIWNIDGNNLLVRLSSSDLSFEEGVLGTHEDDVTASFSAAPYDGSVVTSWIPIGITAIGFSYFAGSFNGKGCTVSNMTVNLLERNYCGLFASNMGAEINSLSIVNMVVSGGDNTGGLVGMNSNSATVSNCYVIGNVSGGDDTGGLVGMNGYDATVSNCYATGNVSGAYNTGGLVGMNEYATVTNCYATGNVSGGTDTGGFVGRNVYGSTVTACKYLSDTHVAEADGVEGLTSAQMKDVSNFVGWDFSDVWYMGAAYPELLVFRQLIKKTRLNSKYADRFGSKYNNRFGDKYLSRFGTKYQSRYGDF